MVAVIEQKNPCIEKHPVMDDNIYNCELCGVRIALLHIESDQEQFKLCGTCLKEYIDQEAAESETDFSYRG
jgi:ribosome-binding protein aMBF1 (putative translation factor)